MLCSTILTTNFQYLENGKCNYFIAKNVLVRHILVLNRYHSNIYILNIEKIFFIIFF